MPLLAPSFEPPTSQSRKDATPSISSTSVASAVTRPIMPPDVQDESSLATSDDPPSTVSKISLQIETISAELASDLASSLVGHVLFLKNQVPFPIMQLDRIPSGKSTPKALKLRTDLLASFDTLSSHLTTTFSALSTAFALNTHPDMKTNMPTRRGYLAILVGPSIGSAKTRVMFAVDGLVAKVWGERDDIPDSDSDSTEDDDVDDDEGDDEEQDSNQSDTDSSADSDEDTSSPPPSRSPSPSPSTSPLPIHQTPSSASSRPPVPSHSQMQQTLRAANRLLSHTMATADHSMSAELAPSQMHILLRAPRRFMHPAWIPRQTVSATLDGALREFREEAGDASVDCETAQNKRKPRPNSRKVEGVWVTCASPGVEFSNDAAEEDEMIWWSWDGKIVGFAEW